MAKGLQLFQSAEMAYMQGDIDLCFRRTQQAVEKILKDENVTAPIPALVPPDYPKELLGMAFKNFCGYFKDPSMKFTQETQPSAFRFLNSFRVSDKTRDWSRFSSPKAKQLRIFLQIEASLTLGLIAWDAKDRATAAKRYKEALDLADSEPALLKAAKPEAGSHAGAVYNVQQIRDNYELLVENDRRHAAFMEAQGADDLAGKVRREKIPAPHFTRIEAREGNEPKREPTIDVATDACNNCGTRAPKLSVCARCKRARYCDAKCQKENWSTHKKTCVKI